MLEMHAMIRMKPVSHTYIVVVGGRGEGVGTIIEAFVYNTRKPINNRRKDP